jgi:hypothetical protein
MFRNNFIAGTHLIKLCDQSQSNLFKQPKFFCPIADILVSTLVVIFVDIVAKEVQLLKSLLQVLI